ELIREIYFFQRQGGTAASKYNPVTRAFEPAAVSADLDNLRSRFTDEKNSRPVYEDAFAMVLPIYDDRNRIEQVIVKSIHQSGAPPVMHLAEKFGWLVIMLDEPTIRNRVLPDLVAKYFPDNEYKVAVMNKDDKPVFITQAVTGEDATTKIFNMSPDNLFFFANRDGLPRMAKERPGVVIDQRVESHTFSRTESINGTTGSFNIQIRRPAEKANLRTAVTVPDGAESDPWTLRVQHTAGSIDKFVSNERNKSFALGLGVYLLLVGGIAAILISAMRSRRFAQRQIDFVSSISHEFRTPLAVIYSAGENLADGVAKEDGQVVRYGGLIKGEGKKLSTMVEQILEFAGANSGKQKYSFTAVRVSDVVRDALNGCRPMLESAGFDVETDIKPELPLISADTTALSSAIQNLIANSVKYSKGSAWLKVSAMNGGGRIRVSVEDKGIGIPAHDLRQIFEPFYRAKQVVDAQISGNGLGLNLVKKIVESHGGRVLVESVVGSGSKFTIELPQSQN
ncbi:MAG: HAMP domain-containing sensor histidine kinase, partial [Acidobacteriota bacterium]